MLQTPARRAQTFSHAASGSVEGVSLLFRSCLSATPPSRSPAEPSSSNAGADSSAAITELFPVLPTTATTGHDPDASPLMPQLPPPLMAAMPRRPSADDDDGSGSAGSPVRPQVPPLVLPEDYNPSSNNNRSADGSVDGGAPDSSRASSIDTDRRRAMQTPTSIASNAPRPFSRRKQHIAEARAKAASVPSTNRVLLFVARVVQAIVSLLWAVAAAPARVMGGFVARFTERVYEKRQLQRLRAIMEATEDHQTWDDTASALDELQGYAAWSTRNVERTKVFCEPDMLADETVVIAKLAAAAHDPSTASYIQTALHRDLYGCTQDPLYRYYRGTKVFVSEYISAVTQLIEEFAEMPTLSSPSQQHPNGTPYSPEELMGAAALMQSIGTLHTGSSRGGEALLSGQNSLFVSPAVSGAPTSAPPGSSPPLMSTTSAAHHRGLFPAAAAISSMLGNSVDTSAAQPPPLVSTTAEPTQFKHHPLPTPRPIARANLAELARKSLGEDCGSQLRRLVEIAERAAIDDAANDFDSNSVTPSIDSADSDEEERSTQQQRPSAIGRGGGGGAPRRTDRMSVAEKIETLETALRSFGRSALLLSGGAALGMYHSGTVRALWNEGLLPRILTGSSAGAIIASIFCTRTDEEINRLCNGKAGNLLDGMTLNAFELQKDLRNASSLMDVKQLMRCLQENVGGETFLEAYQRTGRVLNVSVAADGREGEKSMLLNYITTPNVIIWSGVAASCSMPGLFSPVQLLKKNAVTGAVEPHLPGQLWSDGSVPCDLPKKRIAELFNVNYFIVSQANPHVVPFLPKPPSHLVNKRKSAIVKRLWARWCSETKYWMLKLYRFGLIPRSGGWELPYLMVNQTFTGDVTIRPIGGVFRALPDFINLTSNPTQRHMEYVVSNAQRQTWPHLLQIQYATEVERCLARCIADLRRRREEMHLESADSVESDRHVAGAWSVYV